MMVPLNTDARRKGREAMEAKLSANKAALVRRAFKAGRPLKKDALLHPRVALDRAQEMLGNLRERMRKEDLLPTDVDAALVYCFPESQASVSHLAPLGSPDVLTQVSQQGALIVGILFSQFDAEMKKQFYWPYFFLLGTAAQAVMRDAGEKQMVKQGDFRA
jgi:hypothetical protein